MSIFLCIESLSSCFEIVMVFVQKIHELSVFCSSFVSAFSSYRFCILLILSFTSFSICPNFFFSYSSSYLRLFNSSSSFFRSSSTSYLSKFKLSISSFKLSSFCSSVCIKDSYFYIYLAVSSIF